jgi:autonomous glycyl radical cofactor GrcA
VRDVREEWTVTANHFVEWVGIEARIDHRSYRTLGIELEPSVKVGVARYAGERGVMTSVLEENRQRAFRNGQRPASVSGYLLRRNGLDHDRHSDHAAGRP